MCSRPCPSGEGRPPEPAPEGSPAPNNSPSTAFIGTLWGPGMETGPGDLVPGVGGEHPPRHLST